MDINNLQRLFLSGQSRKIKVKDKINYVWFAERHKSVCLTKPNRVSVFIATTVFSRRFKNMKNNKIKNQDRKIKMGSSV